MGWVVGGVWIGAAVFGVLVIAFCLYEVAWKSRRVVDGLQTLAELRGRLSRLQADLASAQRAQQRVASAATGAGQTARG